MNTIKAIVVDDERLARQRLITILSELDLSIEILAEAENGKQALEKISALKPDLIFLDIQMPLLDGFDVVSMMPEPRPSVIFITAYDEFAIQAFEVNAIDYLLKPVRKERLQQAVQKAVRNEQASLQNLLKDRQKKQIQKLPVWHYQEILLLDMDDIIWLEAKDAKVFVHTQEQAYTSDFNLDELESRLSSDVFCRIHRSYIVNLNKVKKLIPWFNNNYRLQLINGEELDVARRRLSDLKSRFLL